MIIELEKLVAFKLQSNFIWEVYHKVNSQTFLERVFSSKEEATRYISRSFISRPYLDEEFILKMVEEKSFLLGNSIAYTRQQELERSYFSSYKPW